MEDIRFYDFEFRLCHVEGRAVSSNWTIYRNKIGSFEGKFDAGSDLIKLLLEQDYLVLTQGTKQAIVTGFQIEGNAVTVYGKTVNWILTRRAIPKFKTRSVEMQKDVETIARYVVSSAFSAEDHFALGEVVGFGEFRDFWRNTTHPVFDVVSECLEHEKGAGHRVIFDISSRQWVFQVTKGTQRRLIISEGGHNACGMKYTKDLQDYYNGGYYAKQVKDMGEWDAAANVPPLSTPSASNFGTGYRVSKGGRFNDISFDKDDYIICINPDYAWEKSDELGDYWLYVPSEKEGIYRWEAVLSGDSTGEARQDINKKEMSRTISCEAMDLKYGRDYQLGDSLRIQVEYGGFRKTQEQIVDGISFWYEYNNIGEKPILKGQEE